MSTFNKLRDYKNVKIIDKKLDLFYYFDKPFRKIKRKSINLGGKGAIYFYNTDEGEYVVKLLQYNEMSKNEIIINSNIQLKTSSICKQKLLQLLFWKKIGPRVMLCFKAFEYDAFSFITSHLKQNQKCIEFETVLKIIKDVYHGLLCLHKNGIIHGDIKPENILIQTKPTIKAVIFDFDYSIIIDKHNKFCTTVDTGTPGFLSRNIILHDTKAISCLEYQDDLFALGMTLYNMVIAFNLDEHDLNPLANISTVDEFDKEAPKLYKRFNKDVKKLYTSKQAKLLIDLFNLLFNV